MNDPINLIDPSGNFSIPLPTLEDPNAIGNFVTQLFKAQVNQVAKDYKCGNYVGAAIGVVGLNLVVKSLRV